MVSIRRIVTTTAIAALLVGFVPASNPEFPSGNVVAAATGDNKCFSNRRAERRFTRLMNRARLARGRRRMGLDPELSKVARVHTRDMIRSDTLHHTPGNKLGWRVTRWRILGENVGVGSTVRSLHRAFMASPSHRSNILYGSFVHVGVGARRTKGRLWVTVIFETRYNPGTRLRMPRC